MITGHFLMVKGSLLILTGPPEQGRLAVAGGG